MNQHRLTHTRQQTGVAPVAAITPTTSSAARSAAAHHAAVLIFPPWVHALVGLILLGAWFLGNMMQVQTTQAWILQTNLSYRPDFHIWEQFPAFFSGNMDPRHVIAFISAWGAQIILLTCKVGLERVQANMVSKYGTGAISPNVIRSTRRRQMAWSIIAWTVVVVDSLFDWSYASQMGFWVQVFYTSVTFVTTFYCGTWGIQHLSGGLSSMRE